MDSKSAVRENLMHCRKSGDMELERPRVQIGRDHPERLKIHARVPRIPRCDVDRLLALHYAAQGDATSTTAGGQQPTQPTQTTQTQPTAGEEQRAGAQKAEHTEQPATRATTDIDAGPSVFITQVASTSYAPSSVASPDFFWRENALPLNLYHAPCSGSGALVHLIKTFTMNSIIEIGIHFSQISTLLLPKYLFSGKIGNSFI